MKEDKETGIRTCMKIFKGKISEKEKWDSQGDEKVHKSTGRLGIWIIQVGEAKQIAYSQLYVRLGSKEGQKDLY